VVDTHWTGRHTRVHAPGHNTSGIEKNKFKVNSIKGLAQSMGSQHTVQE
jgi:hypothetical protein